MGRPLCVLVGPRTKTRGVNKASEGEADFAAGVFIDHDPVNLVKGRRGSISLVWAVVVIDVTSCPQHSRLNDYGRAGVEVARI